LRVPAAARLAILSAANAEPTAIDRSPGYGKRSAQSEDEDIEETIDQEAEESSFQTSQATRVPAAVRLAILSAANAEPTAIDRSPGYGKRSAQSEDESEANLELVPSVPLDAVKLKIHSSHGNIVQPYDGDLQYQTAVLRGKRESDNFIPFSVYDDRRVKTLKLEQNDFLALPERLQNQEKKKRNFSES